MSPYFSPYWRTCSSPHIWGYFMTLDLCFCCLFCLEYVIPRMSVFPCLVNGLKTNSGVTSLQKPFPLSTMGWVSLLHSPTIPCTYLRHKIYPSMLYLGFYFHVLNHTLAEYQWCTQGMTSLCYTTVELNHWEQTDIFKSLYHRFISISTTRT